MSRVFPFAPDQDSPSQFDPARPQKFRNARPPGILSTHEAKVDADATAIGDSALSGLYRKCARLWLRQDYAEAVHNAKLRDERERAVKMRRFMDQDCGMRAAAISAFGERITARTADALNEPPSILRSVGHTSNAR